MSAFLKWVLISVGVICVGLGVIGIFVPLLPTTPFLLVAAACFIRSSDRLYQRLVTHPMLGPYIRNYREHRAITRRARIVALVLLWATIGYAAFGLATSLALRIIVLSIATAVTVHLVRLKTLPENGPPKA
ncbi:MAG: YbaN family protein [Gemmatimonadota bacterium]|nr:MAG: YbaN family protein [Gemmatimonadota bacterium]